MTRQTIAQQKGLLLDEHNANAKETRKHLALHRKASQGSRLVNPEVTKASLGDL